MNHVILFRVDVGTICGADYAGEVVKVGSRQDPNFCLKVGDRVAGIVHGGEQKRFSIPYFNFSAHVVLTEEQVSTRTKVPSPSMSKPMRLSPGRSQTPSVTRRR